MLNNVLDGFVQVMSLKPLFGILAGVIVGIIFGSIPGISAIMAIAILLPVTFFMDPIVGICMLLAVYKSGIYGGSISAILINTPGAAASFLTASDGFALTRKGKAGKALDTALFASVTGEALATIVLILVAAPISVISLKAGPIERTFLLIFAFTVISTMAREGLLMGLISCCLGMLFSMVGMSEITGASRFTFGITELTSGFAFTPMLIGILVMPTILVAIKRGGENKELDVIKLKTNIESRLSLKEFKSLLPTILRSTGIGAFIGAMPGLGSTAAAFMAYGEAKRRSKKPEDYGKGSLEGIAAAESANNAVCGSSMIPMLTLGIPGDDVTALLMGAFLIHGLTPGPMIFYESTDIIYAIFAGFLITDLVLLFVARIGFGFFIKVSALPKYYIYSCVTLFAIVGAYSVSQSMFDVLVLIGFTVFGYLMKVVGLNPAVFIVAFILAPFLEQNVDQSLSIVGTDYIQLFSSPISWVFIILSLLFVYSTFRFKTKKS